MANYQYVVATNWGKGFITHEDSTKLSPSGFPGNLWKVPVNNQDANRWIAGVAGVRKTLSEAQTIVDAVITTAQTNWDNDNVEGETEEEKVIRMGLARPADITLTE
jgi:hypothetical protein